MKTRTQKYIDKYCEYIDRLLKFWKKGADKFKIYAIVKKVEFIHYLLGIDKNIAMFSGKLINPNIGYLSYNLKEYNHDERYSLYLIEEIDLRKKHILECKAHALKIKFPIKEIETGAYRKEPITLEKLQELLFSLKQIKKDVNGGVAIDRSEGENANRLLIEMGFVSQWRPLAIETGLVKDSVMPYPRPEIAHNSINWLTGNFCYSDSLKESISKWIDKAQQMLNKDNPKLLTGISPENRSIPLSISRMANLIGKGMTRKKLRSLMDSNYYRYEQVGKQDFVFDVSQFPTLKQKIQA
ncbi:MAG: hypothetical protein ABFD91_09510 [Anaerohalosphaeraceae bacterium]